MSDEQNADAQSDYDSPWKEAIEVYFADCIAFFLPDAYAEIDWSRGYVFLDKELQRVVPDATVGRRLVDKLVQVWRVPVSRTQKPEGSRTLLPPWHCSLLSAFCLLSTGY
jgi:hypothetical protein